MSAESLSVYWGLLFNACIPLEMALNWCSHNCSYCFANLNSPNRTADVSQIMNLLANYKERDNYASHLLRMGYPITCSNHVDFFAKSNVDVAMPILETLTEMGIRYTIQTKGGNKIYDFAEWASNSVFYFTLSTLDEEISRRVEPGAPLPKERLDMMRAVKEKGHRVVAGINPCVPDWLPDPEPLVREIAATGCEGVWVQSMHLSSNQIKNMPDRGVASLGEKVIRQARARQRSSDVVDIFNLTRQLVREAGMETYKSGQIEPSNFFRPYRETYPKTFPLMVDFVNWTYENKQQGEAIYWQEYVDFFEPKLPKGVFRLQNHIGAVTNRHFWKENQHIPQKMTYRELLKECWRNQQINYCPVHTRCFAWAAEWDESDGNPGWIQLFDEDGMPILIFEPDGCDDVFIDCVEAG